MEEQFAKTNCAALVGLGGIGKTEIAVQYAYKYRGNSPRCHIFWVYGSSRQSFDDAYRRIAKELEIPGNDDPAFEHRKAVPRELDRRQTGPWLMIVDNADDYNIYYPPANGALNESEQSEYLAYCLPNGSENGGRLIITTRNARVGLAFMGDFPIIEVLKLAPPDARNLLQSKVPKEKWDHDRADTLLYELDYLPLALTQAAAFVKRNKLATLKDYMGKLCQFHLNVKDVLSYELHDPRRQPGTPNAVFRTWQISYLQIQQENSRAADMLSLMAVLDNQAIPRMLLVNGDVLEIPEMDALQVLLDFSLIKDDGQCAFFSMHPLQQLSSQNWLRLDGSRLARWEENGLMNLSVAMPHLEYEGEAKQHDCSILLPHARIVVSYESNKLGYRSLLLLKMSSYECWLGRYQDFYQHAVQAYEESVKANGGGSLKTFDCKIGVAKALAKMKRGQEAKSLFEKYEREARRQMRLLSDGRQRLPECGGNNTDNSPVNEWTEAEIALAAARQLNDSSKQDPGQTRAAFAKYQEAVDLFRVSSNKEKVLACLNSQAELASRHGLFEDGERLYSEALQESRLLHGDKHSKLFQITHNIAVMMRKQGKFAEAAQRFRSAVDGKESIHGSEHPSTMDTKRHLFETLGAMGNHVEGEILGRRVLKYYLESPERIFSTETKITMNSRKTILRALGKMDEAEGLFRILIFNHKLGKVAYGSHIGFVAPTRGSLLGAEKMLHEDLGKSQEENGPEHIGNLRLLDFLAECLEIQHKWEEAEKHRRKSLALHEHHKGKESEDNFDYHIRLAVTILRQGKEEAALLYLQESLELSPPSASEVLKTLQASPRAILPDFPGQGTGTQAVANEEDDREATPAQDADHTS
ncbi:MAG: hypothetical protein Q9221_004941 [Calogaya cf. arnoldii]